MALAANGESKHKLAWTPGDSSGAKKAYFMACERTLGLLIILPTRLFFSFMTSFIGAGQDWYEFGIFSSRAMGKLVGFAEGFLENT